MGLVDYGSESDEETSGPMVGGSTSAKMDKGLHAPMTLPPPKTSLSSSPNVTLSTPNLIDKTSKTTHNTSLPKKGKGPLRILLDLPPPSAGSSSLDEDDVYSNGPPLKKAKLGIGEGKNKEQLTGLAALLPPPKHPTPAIAKAPPSSFPKIQHQNNNNADAPRRLDKTESDSNDSLANLNGEDGSNSSAMDFFGLAAVTSGPKNADGSIRPDLKASSISSAPTLASITSTPQAAAARIPTADDPYPGFTQLPSGQWVAKDQDTYDRWMEAMASEQNKAASGIGIDGFEVPKGFMEKDIRQVGGLLDTEEEIKKSREAWANRPQIIPRPGSEQNEDLAKLKVPAKTQGAGRAKQRGQLSALLADAVANRAELEERIAQGRANRKSAGNKYGF